MEEKEKYRKPETAIIFIEMENVIASSIEIDENEIVNGPARSKKIWDN